MIPLILVLADVACSGACRDPRHPWTTLSFEIACSLSFWPSAPATHAAWFATITPLHACRNFRRAPLPGTRSNPGRTSRPGNDVVVPGDPMASRMLMHPLAAAAGGDPFHAGGKHWTSQSDPEWQTLAAWVRTGAPGEKSSAAGSLDFEFYRTKIEPIFLKPRRPDEGSGNACYTCHTKVASRLRLQPLSPATTSWTEAQSRKNFEIVARLVAPGEPLKSPLLLHPLAPEAGGDPTHTGGKFWASEANPEWQMLAPG